jgi:hypothetical protein
MAGCLLLSLWYYGSALGDENKANEKPAAQAVVPAKAKPKITIHKDVTFFTKPLNKDGYVDYAAALNEYHSKGVTPETNAVVLLYKAFGPRPDDTAHSDEFFRLLGMKKPPVQGQYFKSMSDFSPRGLAFAGVRQQFIDELDKSSERPWKSNDLKIVASWIEVNESSLKLIEQAVKCTTYYLPLTVSKEANGRNYGLIGVLLPSIQLSYSVEQVMVARAMHHLEEGRTQKAWNDLIVVRKFSRLVAQGPTLIEGIVGIKIENRAHASMLALIEHSKPDAEQVEKYIAQLDQIDKLYATSHMEDKINIGERAMYLDAVHRIAQGSMNAAELGDLTDGRFRSALRKFAPNLVDWNIDWDVVLRNGNKTYDRLVKIMQFKTCAERTIAVQQFESEIKKNVAKAQNPLNFLKLLDPNTGIQTASDYTSHIMAATLLPAGYYQSKIAEDRVLQRSHLLRIALALSAHRADHGRYPKKLDALKAYLTSIPKDIFKNGDLTYKATPETYLVYSVGRNQEDENGQWHSDTPSGDDIRIRIPIIKPRD